MNLAAYDSDDIPSPADVDAAKKAREQLIKHGPRSGKLVLSNNRGIKVTLGEAITSALFEIIEEISKGNAVNVVPLQPELTTQQAADLLNVSRPFLIQLLEDKKIAYRKVGRHRRILYKDLVQYKKKIDQQRYAVLDELTAQAQELNMGY